MPKAAYMDAFVLGYTNSYRALQLRADKALARYLETGKHLDRVRYESLAEAQQLAVLRLSAAERVANR